MIEKVLDIFRIALDLALETGIAPEALRQELTEAEIRRARAVKDAADHAKFGGD